MEDFKVKKLDGDNYHAWAIRARAMMVQKKCWEAIEPGYSEDMKENERKKNDEALTLMFLIVEDTFLDDIGDCVRARDAWNALKEMHTKFGLLHILQLMKDFFNTTMKSGESIQSYLARLMEIHRKLSNGGYGFTDREVALVMLIGLPKSYESLILNLEKDEANLTTTGVKSRLLIEEKRISRNSNVTESYEERALHTRSFNNNQKKPVQSSMAKKWPSKKTNDGTSSMKKNTKCFSCGEWGHVSRNCEEAQVHQKSQSSAKTAIDLKTDWALLTNQEKESPSNLWILDSGATEHMTSDRSKFTNLTSYSSVVEVANSDKIKVTGIGEVKISICEDSGKIKNITLASVLYVPDLGGNLLSIGRIEERGFRVEFAQGTAKVLSGNKEVVLKGKRKGRLYVVEEDESLIYTAKIATSELWHSRLGHPCQSLMKDFEPISGSTQTPNKPCPVCIQGKMRRKQFPKSSNSRATEVLEIIHSDVVGKISPPSLGGSNYFVAFTDDFSRYSTVYPLKKKNEVLEKFAEYKQMSENFHNKKVKILRSDHGGEFKSEEFNKYLAKHGIQRQLSVPESPQQNGVSERMNQTLANITRCLLIESGADPTFWAEAVCTAAYLHNRRPSTAIGRNTPERLWSGKETDLRHLKIFGCRAWSHLRSTQRQSKFDSKACECVLVGYPDGIKGYKLWDLKRKKFLISRDVVFEENIFPFKSQQVQPHDDDNKVIFHIEDEETEHDTHQPETNTRIPSSDADETNQHLGSDNSFVSEEIRSDLLEEETRNDSLSEETSNDFPSEDVHHNLPHNINEQVEEDGEWNEGDTETQETYAENSLSRPSEAISCNRQTNRSRAAKIPQRLKDYVLYEAKEIAPANGKLKDSDPMTAEEALASPEASLWRKAMDEEIENLRRAQTWELVTRPPNTKLIKSRWIFRKKKGETEGDNKFKARLVAKGYMQVLGVDFQETFSPVIKLKSIRLLIAIAVEMSLDIHQMDITAAYLNGVLEDDIYMTQPEGCLEEGSEHLVCHLKKSLYGLRQSGRVWNTCLDNYLMQYGLERANADPCIYYNTEKGIIVGVYVDDLLIIGKLQQINDFKENIKSVFVAKDLGPASHILSMKITQEEDGSVSLDQTSYIAEILETFKMADAKCAATPLDVNLKFSPAENVQPRNEAEKEKFPYRQAIGSLLYLACGTRPDLAYASTFMSQFNEVYSEEHWRGVKHIFRYLRGTKDRKLKYRKSGKGLRIYSDADWGGDRTDRKSFSGYIVLLAGAPVSWSSKKQQITALSSTEAEYVAMCHVMKEVQWMNNLLKEICVNLVSSPQTVCVDNQGAIFLANNRVTSERSKHIDIKYHFIRDLINQSVIKFVHVKSEDNLADILTKKVTKRTLVKFNYAIDSA